MFRPRNTSEAPVSGEHTTNTVAFFATDYSFFTYDTPKTNVGVTIEALPNLTDFGRVRVDFSGGVSREVLKDFTIGFTLYNAYDSRPPHRGCPQERHRILSECGLEFLRSAHDIEVALVRSPVPVVLGLLVVAASATAQDLEPKAYSASPVGAAFVIAGVARSTGSIVFDPTLPFHDVNAKVPSMLAAGG